MRLTTVLVTAYLTMGVLLVTSAHRHITKYREWDWQDNVITVVTIVLWPLMILVGLVLGKGGPRA